jgi:hypothetical protein
MRSINAEGGTRTHMALRPHAPETCASTNFATSANFVNLYCRAKSPRAGTEPYPDRNYGRLVFATSAINASREFKVY